MLQSGSLFFIIPSCLLKKKIPSPSTSAAELLQAAANLKDRSYKVNSLFKMAPSRATLHQQAPITILYLGSEAQILKDI